MAVPENTSSRKKGRLRKINFLKVEMATEQVNQQLTEQVGRLIGCLRNVRLDAYIPGHRIVSGN
jgi:tetrahydromethanopterin S-methyltransferase subunit G